jgi:biotin transporter BioY
MFSAPMIGFLVGISAAAWVYSKTMRRTGNNTQSSLILAGLAGFIVFVMVWIIAGLADDMLG